MNETSAPSTGQRVARAAIILMAAFLVSRVLGLLRQMVIAQQFATAPELSAYFAAFRIPDLLFNLIAGGALGSAFIPTLATTLARNDQRATWRLVSAVANWLMLIVGLTTTIAALFAPWVVSTFLLRGFPADLQVLTVHLMRIMLLSTVVFSLSGLLMATLYTHEHFLLPAIAPSLYNLGIIFGALVLAPRMGITGLAWGVVLGAVAHLLVQVPALWHLHARYTPLLGLRDPLVAPGVHETARLMAPRVLGQATVQLNFVVTTALASFLDPQAISALNYAWLIMLLPQGIFAQAVATAAFPTFAAQVARHETEAMRRTLTTLLRGVLFLTLPAAVGLFVLATPIVALLLQRGAFDAHSTAVVAWALLFYAPGLVGHSLFEMLTRAFYALHDTLTPVLVGVAAMMLNIMLSLVFMRTIGDPTNLTRGPHAGLALANTIATTIEALLLLWLLRQRMGGLEGRRLLHATTRLGMAALGMGALLWLGLRLPWLAALPAAAQALVGIPLGALCYLVLAYLLDAEDVHAIRRMLLRR
nr:murein biosynthesis integral membrane protein MurJ [Ardenticatena sp.]